MGFLLITLTLLITGAGMTLSITQMIKIRSNRDSFTSRWDYISALIGQAIMTVIAFVVAIVIINQILL